MSRRLGDSDDVATAAIDVSRGTWADQAADIVVLGRDDVFADTLAGASLAGTSGPILFTDPDRLPNAVADEIDRVLAPDGCVVVLGGTDAVAAATEEELAADGRCVERVAGTDRIATALAVARRIAADTSTERVLLARSDTWYDAVAAGAYSGRTGTPIVVTPQQTLDPRVAAYLDETDPDEVVVLGGTGALSNAVATAAGATERVAGTTRDETAVAIAAQLWSDEAPVGVTVVNGHADTGWAYAIAASPTAARERAPIVFTQATGMTAATARHIAQADPAFTITAGPPSLIQPGVAYGHGPTADLHEIDPPASAPARYRTEVFDDVTVTKGITYGTATNRRGQQVTLQLDLYEPADPDDTAARRPLVVWIHGGGFSSGNRTSPELVDQATELARRGYVSASISYRLEPEGCSATGATEACIVAIQEAHEDARSAIRFLRARAGQYRIDADRVAVAGTSAGAITALNVGYTSSESPADAVQAAVSLSGAALLGPISEGDAPALAFHGDADRIVPYEWARSTIDDATELGLLAKLTTYPGEGHVPYGQHRDEIIEQTARFLWWTLALDGADR